jgi:DNA-directed RNA polymerase specialized sigma24 family protein
MGSRQNKPSGRSRWELSRDALDHLLQRLDPDRDAAGRAYEALRRRLIDLFAWEHGEAPEELADEALNRLARRLSEGVAIDGGIARYAFGIARLLLHEQSRARRNRDAALREFPIDSGATEGAETLRLLLECLDELPPNARDLIERYYGGERDALARSLGISLNALRNRALRVREVLYECVCRKRDV